MPPLVTIAIGRLHHTLQHPQSASAAAHSHEEHAQIVKALGAKDEERAVQLMQAHLLHVEESLTFDRQPPVNDLSLALS